MVKLGYVPQGLAEVNEYYGNPDKNGDFVLDPDFLKNNCTIITTPYVMRASWNPALEFKRLWVHKKVAPAMVDALREIVDYKGYDYIHQKGYDYTGGTYNFRYIRTQSGKSTKLSTHSWGIAIDINPHLGPLGIKNHKQPQFIIDAFEKRGFFSGRHFADAMHFQGCRLY